MLWVGAPRDARNSLTRAAKSRPSMRSSAMSMSSLCFPSSLSRTQPPATRSVTGSSAHGAPADSLACARLCGDGGRAAQALGDGARAEVRDDGQQGTEEPARRRGGARVGGAGAGGGWAEEVREREGARARAWSPRACTRCCRAARSAARWRQRRQTATTLCAERQGAARKVRTCRRPPARAHEDWRRSSRARARRSSKRVRAAGRAGGRRESRTCRRAVGDGAAGAPVRPAGQAAEQERAGCVGVGADAERKQHERLAPHGRARPQPLPPHPVRRERARVLRRERRCSVAFGGGVLAAADGTATDAMQPDSQGCSRLAHSQ